MAAGGLQGLEALSPRCGPPLGAFIKLPALRVVHDCQKNNGFGDLGNYSEWPKVAGAVIQAY